MWIELKRVKNHAQDQLLWHHLLELFPFVNFLREPGQVTNVFRGTPNSSYMLFTVHFI